MEMFEKLRVGPGQRYLRIPSLNEPSMSIVAVLPISGSPLSIRKKLSWKRPKTQLDESKRV
jgi:hypothetical protein